MTDHTKHMKQLQKPTRTAQIPPGTRKLSMTNMTDCTNCTHPGPTITTATSMTSCKTVSINSTQRPNKETETPEHKTLNNTLVSTNEVSSTTWKSSKTTPPTYIWQKYIRIAKTSLLQGSKTKEQHTRKMPWTPDWVHIQSNNLLTAGPSALHEEEASAPSKTD